MSNCYKRACQTASALPVELLGDKVLCLSRFSCLYGCSLAFKQNELVCSSCIRSWMFLPNPFIQLHRSSFIKVTVPFDIMSSMVNAVCLVAVLKARFLSALTARSQYESCYKQKQTLLKEVFARTNAESHTVTQITQHYFPATEPAYQSYYQIAPVFSATGVAPKVLLSTQV